jgi:hypothetical protein
LIGHIHAEPAKKQPSIATGILQRKCDKCKKKWPLQRKAMQEGLWSPGQPLDTYMELGLGHDFSRIPLHPPARGVIQTKLAINAPGDRHEQEADRIADQVMAVSSHHAVSGASPRIQRFAVASTRQALETPASVDRALARPGRPLEPALRQDMEERLGHDFSKVRVHTGAAAEQSAQDVNAHAYTIGHNIVFSVGRFVPGTHEGRRLIAHELTHTVQADAAVSNPVKSSSPIDALEYEAQQVVAAFHSGGVVPPISGAARDTAEPLRTPNGDPGVPTLGPLNPNITPRGGFRFGLEKIGGKWYEIELGTVNRKLASGYYSFVVQEGRVYASHYGHLEAALGKRVALAGEMIFANEGVLEGWTAGSGSYRGAQSFAIQAGEQVGLDKVTFNKILPESKGPVQLPVFQPEGTGPGGAGEPSRPVTTPGGETTVPKPKGGFRARLGAAKGGFVEGLKGAFSAESIAAEIPLVVLHFADRAAALEAIRTIQIKFAKEGFAKGVAAGVLGWREEEVQLNLKNLVTSFRVRGLEDPAGILTSSYIFQLAEAYENYAVDRGYQFSSSKTLKWKEDMRAKGFAVLVKHGDMPRGDPEAYLFETEFIKKFAETLRTITDPIIDEAIEKGEEKRKAAQEAELRKMKRESGCVGMKC